MSDRNLNPTPEALVAMSLRGDEYGPQRLGSMDWFDALPDGKKRMARDLAQRIIAAGKRHGDPMSRAPTTTA